MAVIGLGWFGENHTQVLADMPGVELAALCTRRPERLQEFADRFHVGKTYTDYRELLADPDIDAVSIVTHVNDHRDLAVAALQAGKHVLLEKPMAGTVEDCETILKAAKAAKGIFMVGHICRFDARVNLAKQAVAAGRIGEIISMHATRNLPADLGAIVLNQISSLLGDGIHDGDIMLWLTGKPVETVYAKTIRYRDLKYPDGGWAMYTFQGGAVGVIETLWCLPVTTGFTIDARMEIIGTEGAIYIDCGNAGLTISDEKGLHKPDTAYWPEMLASRVGALRTELEYFAGCARRNQAPEVTTPEESLAAVKMIVAAELSAVTGEVVTC
jgi:UDP-N-acetylglucosamine 3-dehydrogenase